MNIEHYRRRLLELERDLLARAKRDTALGRDQTADSSRDIADAGVAEEAASQDFAEAELDTNVVQEVQAALRRIDEGSFGKCVVDGGPIEAQRLEAVPWTQYCLKHQTFLEGAAQPRKPTL